MQGWIKLHRSVMKSETFSKLTAIQQLIAIYIILNANHEDGVWYDKYKNIEVPVKRGQLIVSRNKIANDWFRGDKEITEQKVRTTLKKLEKLSFLTITPTNNYTLLEVLNYNVYQEKENESNQVINQELTKSQPRANQVLTTNKNDKNDKNEKNNTLRQKFKYEHSDMKLAELLFNYIQDNGDGANKVKSPNMEKWANEIRLIRERDRKTHEQIKKSIEWSQNHHFWKTVILSPSKLREKYQQMSLQAKADMKKTNNEINWEDL
ncbi:hypothetical protein [Bacillus litorisediminis]|uniref:hypothetical protein n=1 Tax=Bacillus litorisediminis TaxID=2922713 RepID=UPI001FAC6B98|nr:hypothetical protein [Bacillus litorisediminis]